MIRPPFKTPERLTSLQHEVSNLLDRLWQLGTTAMMPDGQGFVPAIEIREESDRYVVLAELPGVVAGTVEVAAGPASLTLSGEKTRPSAVVEAPAGEGPQVMQSERRYGRFTRTITLPGPIQIEAVTATARDGVLEVQLPKAASPKPVQVRVEVKGA